MRSRNEMYAVRKRQVMCGGAWHAVIGGAGAALTRDDASWYAGMLCWSGRQVGRRL